MTKTILRVIYIRMQNTAQTKDCFDDSRSAFTNFFLIKLFLKFFSQVFNNLRSAVKSRGGVLKKSNSKMTHLAHHDQ